MKTRLYLLVRCTVETDHRNNLEALAEFQQQTCLQVSDTPRVRVRKTEIVQLNTKRKKG